MKDIRVMTIVGTRPEIIRLSCTIKLLDEYVDQVFVHTGQNYDYELNKIFFEDLQLREPDHFLNVNTATSGTVIGDVISKTEQLLLDEKPDAVLILGDTNSSMAAIIAKRMHIPVFHMEAGNRSFDLNVPEEINRRIIDHISDFNLAYTEHARRNLLTEGLPARRVFVTGSPMGEVLDKYRVGIDKSTALEALKLAPKDYFVISTHREENVDSEDNLRKIIDILNQLAQTYNKRIIVSTHPRTKKRLADLKLKEIDERVEFMKPFGFFDYIALQEGALCTLSDSGTISEESAILGFPAVTIRNSLERPEALDAGSIILTGLRPDYVLSAVKIAMKENELLDIINIPPEYLVKDVSWKVLKLILGLTKLSNRWDGIQGSSD